MPLTIPLIDQIYSVSDISSDDNQINVYANNFRCAHIDNMVSLRADNIDLFEVIDLLKF